MARTGFRARIIAASMGALRGWFRGRRGGLLTWAAVLMVPLLSFVGIGVDASRGYLVRARLSQALDSAGLAAGRWTFSTAKAEEEANMVFQANFPSGYMEATVTGPNLTVTNVSTGNDLITVSGEATIPTYFVRLLGINNFTVRANTEVTRKTVYMDVVVSIDVSGSMDELINGVKKVDAARTAAHTLVDSLFGTAETKELLKMGLLTWNSNVRILPIGQAYNPHTTTSQAVTSYTNPYKKPDGSFYGFPYPTNANFNTVYFAEG
ncbi:MAG: pilus assembly protein TadG-related protein, partial [Alphaproteobacteria bacterium]